MPAGIQFTNYVPSTLLGVNSPSPTLDADVVTGAPLPTGAFPGNCFYLSEQQAQQLSNNTFHAGWYMVVQVDPGATASNIALGTIGANKSIPTTATASSQNVPVAAIMTDVTHALYVGQNPCVFLGPVTPGNFTIVQVAGDGLVLAAASTTLTPGTVVVSNAATATVTSGTAGSSTTVGIAEQAVSTPAGPLTLSSVAASVGGSAVYTGTITGGGSNAYAGLTFTISGFTNAGNNGKFVCTASTATTLTLSNANAVNETNPGTAVSNNLVRVNVSFPFGIM